MLTVLIRTILLFVVAVVAMRIMGKRQISQLQPFELVIAIMIADLATSPMENIGQPLLYGIVPILALMMLHSAFSIASLKSEKLRGLISGRPSILIKKGVIQETELRNICYDLNDLLEELRASGLENPTDVCTAILETSGKMSVFPHADRRPLTPQDMQIPVQYEGIPLTLVLDGEVQGQNLVTAGLTEAWLNDTLKSYGFHAPKEVLLASLDTKGMFFVQGKGSSPRVKIAQALAPERVGW